jgi:hypothetical protein
VVVVVWRSHLWPLAKQVVVHIVPLSQKKSKKIKARARLRGYSVTPRR